MIFKQKNMKTFLRLKFIWFQIKIKSGFKYVRVYIKIYL